MRTRHTLMASLVTAAAMLGVTAAAPAGPTGTYYGVSITGKLVEGDGSTERFDLIVNELKLTRTKIKIQANDYDLDVVIKVTMKLRDRVEDVSSQTVKVESGSLSIKDLSSGTPLAWDGQFNAATYKVKLRPGGVYQMTNKKKLRISDLVGSSGYDGGLVKGVKLSGAH